MRSATRVMTSTLGTFMGLGGLEHGIGEILQGNVAPDGIMISSWPEAEFFRSLAGEPAMTIVPNFLVTGILTVLVSLAFLVWILFFIQKKNGGLVMILLSVLMLLVGGGIFPPILGMLLGLIGTRINAPLTGLQTHFPVGMRRFLGRLWPWSMVACLLSWLSMLPGVAVLSYFFGVDDPSVTYTLLVLMFVFLFLTTLTGFMYDAEQRAGLREKVGCME